MEDELSEYITPLYFCRIDESKYPLPPPIFGLPCHDKCEDGEYATVNYKTRKMECKTCDANFYSVGGGGIRIDGQMGAFSRKAEDGSAMPLRMSVSCQIDSGVAEEVFAKDENCTPWERTGTSLKAY